MGFEVQREKIKEICKDLLDKGTVETIIGYTGGGVEGMRVPYIIKKPEEALNLEWDQRCVPNLCTYLHGMKGKVGIVAKPCDARGVVGYLAENQLARENVCVIGVDCAGMKDAQGDLTPWCEECSVKRPPLFDLLVEECGAVVTGDGAKAPGEVSIAQEGGATAESSAAESDAESANRGSAKSAASESSAAESDTESANRGSAESAATGSGAEIVAAKSSVESSAAESSAESISADGVEAIGEVSIAKEGDAESAATGSSAKHAADGAEYLPKNLERFQKEMQKCILCFSCRQSCYGCYCPTCFMERNMTNWQPADPDVGAKMVYHLGRAMHLAGRCIECGSCERACASGVNVRYIIKEATDFIKSEYGYESGLDTETKPVMTEYKADDREIGFLGGDAHE